MLLLPPSFALRVFKIFLLVGILKLVTLKIKCDTVEFNGNLPEAYKINRNYLSLKCDPHGGMDVVKYMTIQTQRRK
jgi:hypothetical protein